MNRALLKQALDALILAQQRSDKIIDKEYEPAIEALKVEIAKPDQEVTVWLHTSDIKMHWDKTLPYKLDFEKDESWACAVQLIARIKT